MSGPQIIRAQSGGQIAEAVAVPENPRAFPSSAINDAFGGMTLRDWFAGQALAGFLAHDVAYGPQYQGAEHLIARYCFAIADAMIAERANEAYPTREDLIVALEILDRDARPSNWSDEDQPGEPAHDAAAAWRNLDAVLAAAQGSAA